MERREKEVLARYNALCWRWIGEIWESISPNYLPFAHLHIWLCAVSTGGGRGQSTQDASITANHVFRWTMLSLPYLTSHTTSRFPVTWNTCADLHFFSIHIRISTISPPTSFSPALSSHSLSPLSFSLSLLNLPCHPLLICVRFLLR